MKKYAVIAVAFLLAFGITLLLKFPYGLYLASQCEKINRETKLNIVWDKVSTSIPTIKISNVRILSEEKELATFEHIDFTIAAGRLNFKGAKDNCTVRGSLKGSDIDFAIKDLSIPEFLVTSLGKGTISFKGAFNDAKKKGKGTFEAAIEQFPNPLISGSLAVDGQATIEPRKTGLLFNLKGKSITGKGTITIEAPDGAASPQVSGILEIKIGEMPLKFDVKGTLDNISISKAG